MTGKLPILSTKKNWPDWRDVGKRVRCIFRDGSEASGRLIADAGFNGEDEFPIFFLDLHSGHKVSFADAEHYEFLD